MPPRRPSESSPIASQVEALDRKLIELLQERGRLALEAQKQADSSVIKVHDATGEQQILDRVGKVAAEPFSAPAMQSIFREVLSACRALATPLRVAYLGPPYSYSHSAALERFGQSVEYVPVGTIPAVFEEVSAKQSDYGLVPIENSTDGRIVDTLGMFHRLPVRICGDVPLRIHHCLLSNSPRAEIREVHSKPQALSQCREWLAKHLPGVKLVENSSTTAAAELASRTPGVAAIAGKMAATAYGVSIVAANIEDNPNNITRFAVLGHTSGESTGEDKTALMMQLPHRPGSLADAMNTFKKARLNMTWIESFPLPGTEKEYLFFVELEGHEKDLRVRRALKSLQKKTVRLEVLGSYAKMAPVG